MTACAPHAPARARITRRRTRPIGRVAPLPAPLLYSPGIRSHALRSARTIGAVASSFAPPPLTSNSREMSIMEATKTKLVDYRVKNGVAVFTLTDPPANTYTHEMMRDLDECILQARFDENVHVIVMTGAGEKFFCAGANINMLKAANPTFKYFFCLHANETLNRFEQTPKLVIAALNGHTVGGGLEIAMAADIRIARKGAGKVGLPEVSLGVLPGTGGTQRLGRLINKSTAIELMVTGETFDFEKGAQLGIINQVWETASNDEFMERIMKYAESFCPPNRAAKAVGRIKRSVQSGVEVPFESALAIERELQQQLFQSDDAKEGLAAYVEKRKANFTAK
jgi:enoyl-CoA hydratase